MAEHQLSPEENERIEKAIRIFEKSKHLFEGFASGLVKDCQLYGPLLKHIQFIKYRIKDPNHLSDKLKRKISEGHQSGRPFAWDDQNLFEKVNDLAGIRIIHLHTEEIHAIQQALYEIFQEQKIVVVEGPIANCWDIEYEKFYEGIGIETRSRDSMYSTIHYIVQPNRTTKITCEIQVRTLMDEVWGEVSHRVDYPHATPSRACSDQLKVLARLTTGCARLVDSIFQSHNEVSNTPANGVDTSQDSEGSASTS